MSASQWSTRAEVGKLSINISYGHGMTCAATGSGHAGRTICHRGARNSLTASALWAYESGETQYAQIHLRGAVQR
jgi:hypothetical protein